jgi:hypothetical protein
MYPGASFYGIRKTLLAYSKLPNFLPLPVAVQHGWQRVAHEFESSTKPPEIWVWSARIAKSLEQFYPKEKIRIIGSSFCYLNQIINKDTFPITNRHGSVCIPPHSSHLGKTNYSVESFARQLSELSEEFKPIRVMLYYLDINENVVKCYEKYGFEVVSNGELYDSNFLIKFMRNVYDKEYCIFSDLGSGVFYSAHMGLKLHHIDNIRTTIENFGNIFISESTHANSIKFDEKFLRQMNGVNIIEEVGENYMLSPNEMRSLIIKNYLTWEFLVTFMRRLSSFILRRIGLHKND